MTTKKLEPQTALERNVARWANARAADYSNGLEGVFSDLSHGCRSGMVSHLIYYKDTLNFYRKHRAEIEAMINELMEEGVLTSPADLNGWDKSDPFARDTNNRNLLAWFGFEEAANRLANRADIEI